MIELAEVTKRYGAHAAVDGVSFVVEQGETLVLLGRSGSGKTTTLKMINRLVEPSSGTVRIFGKLAGDQPKEELRRSIGYVIQAVGLFPHYTVEENVAVVPKLLGWDAARIAARVDELLGLVGLPGAGAKRPRELSGGQQQRIGLARALAGDPPVVLLDEPFGALDPLTRHEMQAEFKRLAAKLGKTMVLVTHDVSEAIAVGHRICLMEAGKVEQMGSAAELLFEPRTEFVRRFFDEGRLTLELLATTLEDVFPALRCSSATGTEGARVPVVAPLRDVLETREVLAGGTVTIVGRDGATIGAVSAASVLEAFYAFRATRARS
jgi:osmoprotectant transport system ATP-binding protein